MTKELPSPWQRSVPNGIRVERSNNLSFDTGYQANFVVHANFEQLQVRYTFADNGNTLIALQFQSIAPCPKLPDFDRFARATLPRLLISDNRQRGNCVKETELTIATKNRKHIAKPQRDPFRLQKIIDKLGDDEITSVRYEIPLSEGDPLKQLMVGFDHESEIGNYFIQLPGEYNGLITPQFINSVFEKTITGIRIHQQTGANIADTITILSEYLNV